MDFCGFRVAGDLYLITLTSGGRFTIGLLTLTLNAVLDGKKLEIAAKKQFALTAAATMELASGQTLADVLLFGLDLLVVQM